MPPKGEPGTHLGFPQAEAKLQEQLGEQYDGESEDTATEEGEAQNTTPEVMRTDIASAKAAMEQLKLGLELSGLEVPASVTEALAKMEAALTTAEEHAQNLPENTRGFVNAVSNKSVMGFEQPKQQMEIIVDPAKRQEQADAITETDFFRELQARARELRNRNNSED